MLEHIQRRKGVGRPRGAKNRGYGNGKWEPLKWRVDHEAVVLMHIGGKSNKEIAEICEKTPFWVSLVINCKQAHKLIEEARARLPQRDFADRYARILNKSVERLENYLNDDVIARSSPGAMVDRSMRAMEMIDSRLKNLIHKDTEKITERTLILATDQNVDKLVAALTKSDEVTELHRKPADLKLLSNG